MERIETLIQNLQHQLSNNASNAQLLTTAELLVVELRTPANTFIQKVSVQMPYVFVSDSGMEQIAAGGMQYALGLAGRAGGVQDKQGVFSVHVL